MLNSLELNFFSQNNFGIFSFIHQVIRPESSENWTMQIKFPQLRDAGIYECQVSTEPKMSMAFRLNVVGKFSFFLFFKKILNELFTWTDKKLLCGLCLKIVKNLFYIPIFI